ncbi:MAG: homoserine dehydrogenase [Clostridia bacterium]|nr:homoserine dehydrogenase [Clostridia bacterium]
MAAKKVNVAILGLGTVGGGTYDILTQNHDMIVRTQGLDFCVRRVLDRDRDRVVARGVSPDAVTCNIDDIVNDKEIDVVVETMGGVEPAGSFIAKLLESGKTVVTANKELIGKCWHKLEPIAKAHGAGLYFEASCVGGVPIIRTLNESMQANHICELYGIINGTTNYILTKMTEEGLSYETALREAQQLGYAEFNPSADVDGFDAVYKLAILSSLAFHTSIPYTHIYREGITRITADDIKSANELGYVVKLLAIGRREGNRIEARVHPTFVPKDHPLASVRGAFNAVLLTGDFVDDIMLYGRGAGARPTGSAIVSDVVFAAKRKTHEYTDFAVSDKPDAGMEIADDFTSKYYIALTACDRAGVLAQVAKILGDCGVSIGTILQKEGKGEHATITFLTHTASEKAVTEALARIEKLEYVRSIDSLVRCL